MANALTIRTGASGRSRSNHRRARMMLVIRNRTIISTTGAQL